MINKTHLKYNPSIGGNSPHVVVLTKAHQWNGFTFGMETKPLEIWRKIEGFPDYEISSHGRIMSFKNNPQGEILKCNQHALGYVEVSLGLGIGKGRRRTLVHILVGENFIKNPDNKPCINHKDGNKKNNLYTNLEWCTKAENNLHAYATGLKKSAMKGRIGAASPQSKAVIKMDLDGNVIAEYVSLRDVKSKDPGSIGLCCNGKKEAYNGFKWAWKNKTENKF